RIQASGGLSDDDIDKMVHDAEAHADEDKKRKELVELRNNADMLIHSTGKNLDEYGDKVSEEEKSEIEAAVSSLKEVLDTEDAADLKAKSDALMQVAMKLGEAMYKASQEEGGDPMSGTGGDAGDANSSAGDDATVVDADFEEVDPDAKPDQKTNEKKD
ncbi:MAG: Hsp70 family protein, partial [Rhodospirillales bacterium]|nr:Hsp70 family protein [Rhodospirillales bacterium]